MKRSFLIFLIFSSACFAQSKVVVSLQSERETKSYCLDTKPGHENLLALMQRSFPVETTPDGAVCKIKDTGCPIQNCFCTCSLSGCHYWALFVKKSSDQDWTYAKNGADRVSLNNKDVFAWVWTEGNMKSVKTKPSQVKWEDVCRAK